MAQNAPRRWLGEEDEGRHAEASRRPLSKASAIMLGKQMTGGTNVSRVVWAPTDDEAVAQEEVAARDPAHYGPERPLLQRLLRYAAAQREAHARAGQVKRGAADAAVAPATPGDAGRRRRALDVSRFAPPPPD